MDNKNRTMTSCKCFILHWISPEHLHLSYTDPDIRLPHCVVLPIVSVAADLILTATLDVFKRGSSVGVMNKRNILH